MTSLNTYKETIEQAMTEIASDEELGLKLLSKIFNSDGGIPNKAKQNRPIVGVRKKIILSRKAKSLSR